MPPLRLALAERRESIKPTTQLKYIDSLRAGYKSVGATQVEQYSWLGKTSSSYVFTAEIDHIDEEDNIYNHTKGTFKKHIRPLSLELKEDPATIRHADELFTALLHAHNEKLMCRLMLLKGTKYGKTSGKLKSAIDGDYWAVKELSGSVATGMDFVLERVEEIAP